MSDLAEAAVKTPHSGTSENMLAPGYFLVTLKSLVKWETQG